jgi:type IV secretion system protein VirB3
MSATSLEKPMIVPLVKALTRAPTIVGVPYMYFMLEMVATSVIFLATHNLVMLLWMVPFHLFGYIMTLKDDRMFEVLFVKSSKCPPRSRSFWGCDSYKI